MSRGFIKRYVLHLEWHPGYRPRISFRRAPRSGDRVVDGGESGRLTRCRECGDGFLLILDRRDVAENARASS